MRMTSRKWIQGAQRKHDISYSSLIDFFLMLIGVLCLLNFSGGDFLEEVGGLSFRIGILFA